ncbi:glycosyltransferase [Thiohalobacter sp.]|uniref:glycosyltransferase n=1 Tax=Thiohalobacter sp. TaxID=2025948 RepID=UPI002618F091|nr:glycosyltransferase [Thiohalobacter sp.]
MMNTKPQSTNPDELFLSLVLVTRNHECGISTVLHEAVQLLDSLVADYEILVVDNASEDHTVNTIRANLDSLPNIQVLGIAKRIDFDAAAWLGVEQSIGDYVAVLDSRADEVSFIPALLKEATQGADVVFAYNRNHPARPFLYRLASGLFRRLFRAIAKVDLEKEAPRYRLISRRVAQYLMQHRQPVAAYRYLPATAGFVRKNLSYHSAAKGVFEDKIGSAIDRALKLITASSKTPLRVVVGLTSIGATINLAYVLYVLLIAILKEEVEPGWITLSLQQSGMFFLLSVALLVLSEYVLYIVSLVEDKPSALVNQQFTSANVPRFDRLNIKDIKAD